ncbi:di-trans,poly-cis-decaprenylcistransferase [Candidatus Woesebacteria bacterium]|nr:MAG: di-trans,poly-cis-decaprenylcistransferase [Candidatus Woesebacteria bacterium]
METKETIRLPKGTIIPNHIAVVLDGNGRWARSRGLPENKGHEAGGRAIREVIDSARKIGVHTITLWGFSTENWKRPPQEVRKIMAIVKKNIQVELKNAHEEEVRFVHIGRKDRLPRDLVKWIKKAESETRHYNKHVLNLAFDYGGRDEIIRAVQKMLKDGVDPASLDEDLFSSYLDTSGQPYPYPDLFIRTSGEQRTSGLMPWQMTYAEFYFEPDHLPDMNTEKLKNAIIDYSRRRRRFGGKDKVAHFKFKPEVIADLELKWWRLQNIPEGTKLREYAIQHLKEQFGMSYALSTKAAKYMMQAVLMGRKSKWVEARKNILEFYILIKDEVKLAFEPKLAASLQVKFWKEISETKDAHAAGNVEDTGRKLYSEVYRMSNYQATKVAHLRVLANLEMNMAESGLGEKHWQKAGDYLELYYQALKERVA